MAGITTNSCSWRTVFMAGILLLFTGQEASDHEKGVGKREIRPPRLAEVTDEEVVNKRRQTSIAKRKYPILTSYDDSPEDDGHSQNLTYPIIQRKLVYLMVLLKHQVLLSPHKDLISLLVLLQVRHLQQRLQKIHLQEDLPCQLGLQSLTACHNSHTSPQEPTGRLQEDLTS
ncbi:uncharacterized protein LOC135205727 isoform X2 [Macrobrachium nipponense]|uniref:uncharacterized protein LOC135205727 isoform X2 n=1 Tax=Macrobrachium nipponense TaxID=159736 RepID=UPI0030C8BE07